MSTSEFLSQCWGKAKLAWYLFAALAFAFGLWAWRTWQERREAAVARRAQTLKAANATGEAIENRETERIRLQHEARQHALAAQRARTRADQIAGRLERGGHADLAEIVKAWNRQ